TAFDQSDYTHRFPLDMRGQEMGPSSQFWRTYQDVSAAFDGDMIEEYRDTIDVLMVFAGLFSAVVTTFLVQVSQNLSPNFGQVNASLLLELIQVQRTMGNATAVAIVPSSPLSPAIPFSPLSSDVWINGLWVSSLSLSLVSALVAVLAKQWLHSYIAITSCTPRDHGRLRQFRWAGLNRWHVPTVIGLLPIFLHLSLACFFAGLFIF
ncbi:hypothetical protein C8J56DRAFT_728335, partial [Mycena floridula]